MARKSENYLIISDLQIPFELPTALQFAVQIKKEYNIPSGNVYCVGDELDMNWAGLYKKDPDAIYTPYSELSASIAKLRDWYRAFPEMKLAESNHGMRALRLAFESGIPSQLIVRYRDMIKAPSGWEWQKHWYVEAKHPFIVEHGDKNGYGSAYPHLRAAQLNGCSTVLGHYHTIAGVEYFETSGMKIWGAATASLIDQNAYTFKYQLNNVRRPKLGLTVVVDSGAYAVWIPHPTLPEKPQARTPKQ